MNKSDLIHEIFLFDKEIADYGIKKRVLLTNNYLLDKGMLYRKYNSEEISASSLTDENKEKELLAFYEVFFSELDSNNAYKDGNTYAEKVLNFIKRTKSYDKFELINDQKSGAEEYNSIDYHFKKDYNNKFLGQNKLYNKFKKKVDTLTSIDNSFGYLFILSAGLFIFLGIPILIVYLVTNDNLSSFIIGVSSLVISLYLDKIISAHRKKIEKMEYKIGAFKGIDKKECFYEIDKFYKDDLFYKELKKQYNITTTPTGNQIIGE